MRNFKFFITFVIFLVAICFTGISQAGDEIKVVVNDEQVDFPDQKPYIDDNNRTQVPVRFVSEALGSEVTWHGDEQKIQIQSETDNLVLVVNKSSFTLNGEEIKMDTAPQITDNDRTMVPLRFVSEGLGCEVTWKDEKNKVNIENRNNPEQVLIKISASTLNVREGPGLSYDNIHQVHEGETFDILDKRTNEDEEKYTDWIKINLPDLAGENDNNGWISADYTDYIEKEPSREEEKDETKPIPREYSGIIGELTIDVGEDSSLNIRKGPGLEYDRIDQAYKGESYPLFTRTAMANHPEYKEWFKIKLENEKEGWVAAEYIDEEKLTYTNNLKEINFIQWEENEKNTTITLGPIERCKINNFTLQNPDRLVLDLEDILLETSKDRWEIDSNLIERIRANQRDYYNDTRIVFDLEDNKEHYSLAWDKSHLVIRIFEDAPFKYNNIVLDPGHGGSNTGARGPSGLEEKEVVLDVSLRVRDILEELGANVYMTRETDTSVDLDRRPEIATEVGGDIFISIHANAHPNNNIKGTETFYSSSRSQSDIELATELQNSMLNALGTIDRGVKDRDFRVIKNATIPAALVEIAFLSNASEEELLKQDSFRQKAAESIVEGIANYYKVGSFD